MKFNKATVVQVVIVSMLTMVANAPALAQLSADDFLPPAQAKTDADRAALRDVKQADAVKTQTDAATEAPAVTAGSFQDAINAAAKGIQGTGHAMALFDKNRAWIARGMGTYSVMQNPTATRIAKRQAYVKAFMEAKSELATALNGLSNTGKTAIWEDLSTVNDATGSLHFSNVGSQESLSQATECMLRGFVVYDVSDDADKHAVAVTIVTTPKTRGKYNRPNPDSIEAASVAEGVNAALAEVNSGIVPLTGGKVIFVPSTGEMAFVGYGSAVVEAEDSASLQAKLNLAAEKSARAHAMDALCGLIIGEQVKSTHDQEQQTVENQQSADTTAKSDPLTANPDAPDTKQREGQLHTFRNEFKQTDEYQSVRSGKIPAGVNVKTWSDAAHEFAYGAAVYVPSVTKMAEQDKKEMAEGSIVDQDNAAQQPQAQTPKATQGQQAPAFKDDNNPNVPRPGQEVKPGPTGQVQDGRAL